MKINKLPRTKKELVNLFKRDVATSYIGRNPFFESLRERSYTKKQLQMAFAAFAHYRSLFSIFLGQMILRLPIETEEWGAAGLNLAEEYGYGKLGESHGILYANFLRSMGLKVKHGFIIAEELRKMPKCAENFKRRFVGFIARAPLPAIIGMSAAYELLDSPEAKPQRIALQKYGFRDLRYFTEHEVEGAHFSKYNAGQLAQYWHNPKNRKTIILGFRKIYEIQDKFYRELHEFAMSF